MVTRLFVLASSLLLATSGWLPAAAQQPTPSAPDTAAITSEVKATIDKYYRLFSEQNMKALPDEIYLIPWVVIGGKGPDADLTKEQATARFEASLEQLVKNGWGKSVFTTQNVCVLNGSAAIASGFNTRYKKDGSVMSVGGVSYLLGKTANGWRIVSYTGHAKDKVVRCD
ncbi:MAG: nuclear transport factor 2 family protein [Vicinamibacterales bacterium]